MLSLTGTLGVTPIYKCNATICYSSDGAGVNKGTDALFREVQALTNRFSGVAKFSPISVDGMIGAGTVSALGKVVAYLKNNPKWSGAAISLPVSTKEAVAGFAPSIATMLTQIAQDLKLSSVSAPPVVTSPNTSSPVSTAPPPPGFEDLFPGAAAPDGTVTTVTTAALPKWPFYLGGVALALGLGYLAFTHMQSKP